MLEGGHQAVKTDEEIFGTSWMRELERRLGDLERLLGRKTMEVEIAKKALDLARVKKPTWSLVLWGGLIGPSR